MERAELLHVAQSLFHDHVPAKREGLPSVWINRRHDRPGWGATPEPPRTGPTTSSSPRWPSSLTLSTAPSPHRHITPTPDREGPNVIDKHLPKRCHSNEPLRPTHITATQISGRGLGLSVGATRAASTRSEEPPPPAAAVAAARNVLARWRAWSPSPSPGLPNATHDEHRRRINSGGRHGQIDCVCADDDGFGDGPIGGLVRPSSVSQNSTESRSFARGRADSRPRDLRRPRRILAYARTATYAELVNPIPKYVASRTIKEPLTWNSQLLGTDPAERWPLSRRDLPGDLISYGCGKLANYLARRGVVDEVKVLAPSPSGATGSGHSTLASSRYGCD